MNPLDFTSKKETEKLKTPEMTLESSFKFAQTPSSRSASREQVEKLAMAVQRMTPKVSLKLSDVPKQEKEQSLADWGRSIFGIVSKANWSADDLRMVMEAKVSKTHRHQMTSSFETAIDKAVQNGQLPYTTMLLGQLINDDESTRPMEEITIRKELTNLKQGSI